MPNEAGTRSGSIVGIEDVEFGAPAAERDIDHGLESYFVESEAFKRVQSGSKKVVLGNRGTGKSAIFKILAKREAQAGSLVIELAPEDYSYEMLSSVLKTEADGSWAKHGAYSSAWKYLIFVQVMQRLVQSGTKGNASRSYKRVRTFLRDNFKGQQQTKLDSLVSHLKRMEGLKVGKYEASIKSRELEQLYKLEELQPYFEPLGDLLRRQKVLVLVDELDKGWDGSEDAKAFVAGLFQACASMNGMFDGLSVYISLRRELYDSIPALYEDAQKYRDLIEIIDWDETSLLELMASRIRYSVEALRKIRDNEYCWSAVFNEVLEYRKNKSFNYMVDRTLYRPREFIEFATQAVEEAKSTKDFSFPMDYSVIANAENRYSADRTKDIAAEYRFEFPGLDSVFEVFRGEVYALDRERLEEICLNIATDGTSIDEAARIWAHDRDPSHLIDILWRVGFLRALAAGGVKARRRSGSQYVGPHQVANLSLHNIARFQVHPMFRSHLGLKESKSR